MKWLSLLRMYRPSDGIVDIYDDNFQLDEEFRVSLQGSLAGSTTNVNTTEGIDF